MSTDLLPLQIATRMPSQSASGLWKRLTSMITEVQVSAHNDRFYLACAEITSLQPMANTGMERPLVVFTTVDQHQTTTLLAAAFPVGSYEPGHQLTVLYDDQAPAQAIWAGRSWRNEPSQALTAARCSIRSR